jgi:flavin-dependent dehydrogenase
MQGPTKLLAATTTLKSASDRFWDVLVVGAGPAGALAARQLAAGGASVLLVDKSRFPRWKVCGCCLNGSALAALRSVGLEQLPIRAGGVPLARWQLATRLGKAGLRLRSGLALSRQALDAALIEEAIEAGAAFLPESRAQIQRVDGDARRVQVQQSDELQTLRARWVVCADGLSGGALRGQAGLEPRVSRAAHMGAGVVLDGAADDYLPGVIYMACARPGYVGLVRLEDGRLDIAAALHVAAARGSGGPGPLAAELLDRVGLPVPPGLAEAAWKGTAPLTRRPDRVAAERLILAGDAAGYVEPFTGEGIAWALWSAVAAAPLVLRCLESGEHGPSLPWLRWHARSIGRRHLACRMMSTALRQPLLVNVLGAVVNYAPWLAAPVLHGLDSPPSPLPT